MPSKDRRQHRMPNSARLPKVKTINDLLTRDDVNGILADMNKRKPDVTDMIVIYYNKEGNLYGWQITDNTHESLVVWLLESAKKDLMNENYDRED